MRYFMFRDEHDALWRWYLLSEDGRNVAHSMQAFFSAEQCRDAIAEVMQAGPDTPIDESDVLPEEGGRDARAYVSEHPAEAGFEDVGLKRPDHEATVPAREPNELPRIGR